MQILISKYMKQFNKILINIMFFYKLVKSKSLDTKVNNLIEIFICGGIKTYK